MINSANFEQIYSGMIAGRIVNHDADVNLSIFYIARNILGTEKIHLLSSLSADGQHAYYFAAASANFASVSSFDTPLAAAFPTHPDHKGDGVYTLSLGVLTVAVIKEDERFRMVTNSADAVAALIEDLDLPVYSVDGLTPVLMESLSGRYRSLADRFSLMTIKVAAVTLATGLSIGALAYIGNSIFSTSIANSNEKIAQDLNSLVTKIEHASPLSRQLAQIQKVSATVIRAGGWINAYQLSSKGEKFVVTLPGWVTQDYISALGSGTVAEADNNDNVIRVEKK